VIRLKLVPSVQQSIATFAYFKKCLTDVILPEWINVKVHPDDQSHEIMYQSLIPRALEIITS
jgi:hypothetical protein